MSNSPLAQRVLADDKLLITTGTALDNNNAHEMLDAITSAQERGFKFVILDMNELEFLSSAGVGSILGTVEDCREAGGDIILCNLKATVFHVLKVLDLLDYLTVAPDTEEALSQCTT